MKRSAFINGSQCIPTLMLACWFLCFGCQASVPHERGGRSTLAFVAESAIPDQELREALNLAVEGDISPESLTRITALNLEGKDVHDLRGLEYCGQLRELRLRPARTGGNDSIWPRPLLRGTEHLAGLEHLTELIIANYDIDSRHAFLLPGSLRQLELNFTAIPGLHCLEECTELRTLSLSGSQLPSLSGIQYLAKLEVFRANFGPRVLDWSPLLKCQALRELYLDECELSDIAFGAFDAGWPNLEIVYLRQNKLMDFRFLAASSTLTIVNIEGNPTPSSESEIVLRALRDKGVKVLF